jgi:hypothetical protein
MRASRPAWEWGTNLLSFAPLANRSDRATPAGKYSGRVSRGTGLRGDRRYSRSKCKIVDLDGSLPEAKVWMAIQTALDEAGLKSATK